MNFAIRPDLRPLRRISRLLPSALAIAASACGTYEPGAAILPKRLLGCVQSEHSTNPEVTPRGVIPQKHELSVYFGELERVVPLEAVGEYAKKIDADFNPGDSVKLIIMLGAQYNRRDPQGRANAEISLNSRLSDLLKARRFALDETATQLRLEKSPLDACSETPN